MNESIVTAVNVRYGALAEKGCCLSCGGAVQKAEVTRGEICVDLGSGRGTDVIRMADMTGESGFVYGVDISDKMLEKGMHTALKLGIKNCKFLRSELESLPLEGESADLVISNCTINHAADKQTVWNEVFRILKKGGRFVVSDIYSTAPVPEEYRNDPAAVAECWAGSVEKGDYLNQLSIAGFREIEILEESSPYPKGSIEVVSWTIRGFKK